MFVLLNTFCSGARHESDIYPMSMPQQMLGNPYHGSAQAQYTHMTAAMQVDC